MRKKKRHFLFNKRKNPLLKMKGMDVPILMPSSLLDEYVAGNPGKSKMDLLIEIYPDIQTALEKYRLLRSIGRSAYHSETVTVKRSIKGLRADLEITAMFRYENYGFSGPGKLVIYLSTKTVNLIVPLSEVEDIIMERLINV